MTTWMPRGQKFAENASVRTPKGEIGFVVSVELERDPESDIWEWENEGGWALVLRAIQNVYRVRIPQPAFSSPVDRIEPWPEDMLEAEFDDEQHD